jgi:uncharacterized repeat protein (TIGR03803 family)
MHPMHIFRKLFALAVGTGTLLLGIGSAQTEKLIHSFAEGTDGALPYAGLIGDSKGNGYGTTYLGGKSPACLLGCGTVYKISPSGNLTIVHAFVGGTTDGCIPRGLLVIDKSGNLYGTTPGCGTNNAGTAFKISSSGTETILHNFGLPGDGSEPQCALAIDAQGNLYGTTPLGGAYSAGTVFKVTPSGVETVVYSFTGAADGKMPIAGLIFGARGNLYGTTSVGGLYGRGTVFELSPSGAETVLYSFAGGSDGNSPQAGLVLDKRGYLYGTTIFGGTSDFGTVFVLNPSTKQDKILHSFSMNGDGYEPSAGVVLDTAQLNLYGTTMSGGSFSHGTLYKVSLSGAETIVYNFGSAGDGDGAAPYGTVVLDSKANIYGTTSAGGAHNLGTVYRITP